MHLRERDYLPLSLHIALFTEQHKTRNEAMPVVLTGGITCSTTHITVPSPWLSAYKMVMFTRQYVEKMGWKRPSTVMNWLMDREPWWTVTDPERYAALFEREDWLRAASMLRQAHRGLLNQPTSAENQALLRFVRDAWTFVEELYLRLEG